MNAWHTPDEQSAPTAQAFPAGHPAQGPPQSASVSVPPFTPSRHDTGTHRPAWHAPVPQSAGVTHATHEPAPSHTFPPPSSQGTPAAFGGFVRTPSAHRSSVHWRPSTGASESSTSRAVPPFPSQIALRQSPGIWAFRTVPNAASSNPHAWPVHVGVPHSPPVAGHSAAARHSTHTAAMQWSDAQSAFDLQACPGRQPGHLSPPQSTAVSRPFFALSSHVAAMHVPSLSHTPSLQSVPVLHGKPAPHPAHFFPPQSTPVSSPFFTLSAQLAATHFDDWHTPDAQSVPELQSTHFPAASQTFPPLSAQAVPAATAGLDGCPSAHRSRVQRVPSSGMSRTSYSSRVPPFPSHSTRRQSPGSWTGKGVPSATGGCSGTSPVHTSSVHAFLSSGRSFPSATVFVPPCPSHTTALQSPGT